MQNQIPTTLSAGVDCSVSTSGMRQWIRYLLSGLLIACSIMATTASTVSGESTEYCQMQTFEASCAEDEVILMKTARYGRMRLGRCLTRNYYVGCSADVGVHMHARCSGRRHCRVPIPDPAMFAAQPCPKDLVAYLEADYECVKVAKSTPEDCIGGGPQVLTASSGFLSRPPTRNGNQKHNCPRRIEAQPGQKINVYLYDFFYKHLHSNDNNNKAVAQDSCITYGYVSGGEEHGPTRICGGEFKKNHLIYSSESNVVDITLTEPSAHSHHYILKYEMIGCPELDLPGDAWVQYQEETAVVSCNNSKTAFHLVCVGNEWVGELQNCTEASVSEPVADSMSSTSRLPFGNIFVNTGLFLAISIGVALGVLLGIGLLTLAHTFYSTRRGRSKAAAQSDGGQVSLLKKPVPFMNDSCLDHGHIMDHQGDLQHQHIHVPISLDTCGDYGSSKFIPLVPIRHITEHLYESPRPGDMSTFRAARITMCNEHSEYTDNVDLRMAELDGRTTLPPPDCCHNIYDLGTLGRDKIITIDNDAIPS